MDQLSLLYKSLALSLIAAQQANANDEPMMEELVTLCSTLSSGQRVGLLAIDRDLNHLVTQGTIVKTLTSHQINPANKTIHINTGTVPHPVSKAYSVYHLSYGPTTDRDALFLRFQDGPVDAAGNGVNGITHEALLAVLIDRLTDFQTGPYACQENQTALDALVQARTALESRTLLRQARGVEGQHRV